MPFIQYIFIKLKSLLARFGLKHSKYTAFTFSRHLMRRTGALLILVACVFGCKESDPLTPIQRTWVNQIDAESTPLQGADPSLSDADLAPFDFLSDAKIVGLGEGSHGAREFFQIKHRIFQYLVEKHGFRAFAFEMDFAESIIFDDYIQGKTNDDLHTLMSSKMLFWTWKTEEVQELFEWMRTYNKDKPEPLKIHLYGVDCQFPTYSADFLVQRVSAVDPLFATVISTKLEKFKTLGFADSSNYNLLLKNVNDVYNTVLSNKDLYLSKGMTTNEFAIALQLARNIIQTHNVIYKNKIEGYYKLYRDGYMAENAQWVSDFVGGNQKICLWAHNDHVRADIERMGYYLKASLKGQYKNMCSTFATGSFNAVGLHSIVTSPIESSTNYLLHQVRQKTFAVNVATTPTATPLGRYFYDFHGILNTYATYDGNPEDYFIPTNLSVAFDMLVYFDKISASRLFN